MVNYLLMMTWLPASVSLNERISCYAFKWWMQTPTKINSMANFMGIYLQNKIEFFVVKMPFLWIFLFGKISNELHSQRKMTNMSKLCRFHWHRKRSYRLLLARISIAEHAKLSIIQQRSSVWDIRQQIQKCFLVWKSVHRYGDIQIAHSICVGHWADRRWQLFDTVVQGIAAIRQYIEYIFRGGATVAAAILSRSQAAAILPDESRSTDAAQLLHRKFHRNNAETVNAFTFDETSNKNSNFECASPFTDVTMVWVGLIEHHVASRQNFHIHRTYSMNVCRKSYPYCMSRRDMSSFPALLDRNSNVCRHRTHICMLPIVAFT